MVNKYPIEGGKFELLQKGSSYGLLRTRDQRVLGWVLLGKPISRNYRFMYPLINIQVLPEFRNTVAVLVLINAVRMVIQHPVYIDNPVFAGGESLLNAIAKRANLPDVYIVNKQTGEKTMYRAGMLTQPEDVGVLFNRTHLVYSMQDYYPGGSREITLSLFEDFHSELLADGD